MWERWLIQRYVHRNAQQNSNGAACDAGGQNEKFFIPHQHDSEAVNPEEQCCSCAAGGSALKPFVAAVGCGWL